MSFHQHSKSIVTEYLGTVAYVDDLIFSEKKEIEPIAKSGIQLPTRTSVAQFVSEVESDKKQKEGLLIPNINPKTFTNAFLKKGIHCSLFEIANDADSLNDLVNILCKSDIVILDWQMHQDNGRKAIELLKSVISKPAKPELRLFIVYTNARNYKVLLEESIIPELKKLNISGDPDDSGCIYKFGHSKIVVLEKTNGKNSATAITDEELPDKIIEEFTEITEGLVSNTALKAVSVTRRNTHSLLAKFNKELDAAYFNHRAFLETPTDSELHLVNWLSDEIKDMLFLNNVSNETNIENIKLAIEDSPISEFSIFDKKGVENKKISKDLMLKLLSKGCVVYNKENNDDNHIPTKWFKYFYKSFSLKDTSINERFAALSSLSSSSFTHDEHQLLTLGVVIENGDYILICIQPSCDSIRLEKGTKFVFLTARKCEEKFDLVIPNKEDFLKFGLSYKTENIELISFTPQNRTIVSKTVAGQEVFEDIDKKQYKWLCNLKYPFAQRISTKFAYEISRVGLDESEWLRRIQATE